MADSLTIQNLLRAYAAGYFPMPHPLDGEIVWMRPNPRAVLPIDGFQASRSLLRNIKRHRWQFSVNQNFAKVMELCGSTHEKTWIDERFLRAYVNLNAAGFCRSVEVWEEGELVGGLYGVTLNGAFFAESMFRLRTDASKAALWALTKILDRFEMSLLEVQFLTPHLERLGAVHIHDQTYRFLLNEALSSPAKFPPHAVFLEL